MALLLCNCQKDELPTDVENTLTPISQSPIQKIQYHQLPSYIKDQVNNSAERIADKGLLKKTSTPFGDIIQDQVGILTTNDGVSSYTFAMKSLASNNELSIDNLVITENSDGTLSSQIIRYKPSEKWLQNRNSKGLNWDNYSGEIMIYDDWGKLKAVGEFLNGEATRKTTNKEMAGRDDVMDCVVTEVSVAGLEQNGEFYPTDIIIDYHCSSGGGAGGGSDHGLPNGGGEFPHNTGGTHGGGGGSSANNGSSNSPQIPTVIDDRLLFDKIDGGESNAIPENLESLINLGTKPIAEYSDKCAGIQNIWNSYPNNEVSGYITQDNQLLVIDVLPYNGGTTSGTYTYNNITYYPYPDSSGPPTNSYNGMLHSSGYYLIPVKASVHTHSPCRRDGTNGVSHGVGSDDLTRALKAPNIKHFIVGCRAIAEYNGTKSNFFNIQTGFLSTLCKNIQ